MFDRIVDRRSLLKYAVGAGIAAPFVLDGLIKSQPTTVSGESLDICKPIQWDLVRQNYPDGRPLGVVDGGDYVISESIRVNQIATLIGGRAEIAGVKMDHLGDNRLVAVILHPGRTGGSFNLKVASRFNIRRDGTLINSGQGLTEDEINALKADSILNGRQFQGGQTFRFITFNAETQTAQPSSEMSAEQATDFLNQFEAKKAQLCATPTPTTTRTATATATITPSATAAPTEIPSATPTPKISNKTLCPIREQVNGWSPDWSNGADKFPFGNIGETVQTEIVAPAFTTAALAVSYAEFTRGQTYKLAMKPTEVGLILSHGGGKGARISLGLKAKENVQWLLQDPQFGLTDEVRQLMMMQLMFRAFDLKRAQGVEPDGVQAVEFFADGRFEPSSMNIAQIVEFVNKGRFPFCSSVPVLLNGGIN